MKLELCSPTERYRTGASHGFLSKPAGAPRALWRAAGCHILGFGCGGGSQAAATRRFVGDRLGCQKKVVVEHGRTPRNYEILVGFHEILVGFHEMLLVFHEILVGFHEILVVFHEI